MDAHQVQAVILDYRAANLDPATVALMDFCVKLTRAPGEMADADIAKLREFSFSDAEISNAVMVTALFNSINRVVEALGAEPEPEWDGMPSYPPVPW